MILCLKIGEDGLFPQLPFTEITMKDQDKTEDLFKVLDREAEKPYFIYFPFYVCLAIIKRNNYHATKGDFFSNKNKIKSLSPFKGCKIRI